MKRLSVCSVPNLARILAERTLELLHVQADLCDKPHDNRSLDVKLTAWITGIVSVGALALRFVSRCMGGSKLWWDDWLQLISIVRRFVDLIGDTAYSE